METNTENLNISLELSRRWLERHEVPSGPGTRCFRMSVAGEPFELRLDHRPEAAPHAGSLPEDPRAASNQEVLLAVARAFLGSLVEYPRPEPDLERGWEAYRTQLLETHGFIFCPPWQEMSGEHKEAVACLVRTAWEVPSDQPALRSFSEEGGSVISEQQPLRLAWPRRRKYRNLPIEPLEHRVEAALLAKPTRVRFTAWELAGELGEKDITMIGRHLLRQVGKVIGNRVLECRGKGKVTYRLRGIYDGDGYYGQPMPGQEPAGQDRRSSRAFAVGGLGDENPFLADVRWTPVAEGLDPDTDEFRERKAANLADHGGPEFVSLSLKEWQARETRKGGIR